MPTTTMMLLLVVLGQMSGGDDIVLGQIGRIMVERGEDDGDNDK